MFYHNVVFYNGYKPVCRKWHVLLCCSESSSLILTWQLCIVYRKSQHIVPVHRPVPLPSRYYFYSILFRRQCQYTSSSTTPPPLPGSKQTKIVRLSKLLRLRKLNATKILLGYEGSQRH